MEKISEFKSKSRSNYLNSVLGFREANKMIEQINSKCTSQDQFDEQLNDVELYVKNLFE